MNNFFTEKLISVFRSYSLRFSKCLNLKINFYLVIVVFVIQFSRYKYRLNRFVGSFMEPNGDDEIRTRDPLLARQVLSQLSYTPTGVLLFNCFTNFLVKKWAQVDSNHRPHAYQACALTG